jgi:hypothetical protein
VGRSGRIVAGPLGLSGLQWGVGQLSGAHPVDGCGGLIGTWYVGRLGVLHNPVGLIQVRGVYARNSMEHIVSGREVLGLSGGL